MYSLYVHCIRCVLVGIWLGWLLTVTLPVSDHVEAVTQGYAEDTGGVYVICIWGVTQMGELIVNSQF